VQALPAADLARWCGRLVRAYLWWLCRTVARAGDVRGEGLFGVVHMLGDQLQIGVLGGGDQLQQGVDVLDVRGAVWDGYATAESGFDVGQDLSGVGFDTGPDTLRRTGSLPAVRSCGPCTPPDRAPLGEPRWCGVAQQDPARFAAHRRQSAGTAPKQPAASLHPRLHTLTTALDVTGALLNPLLNGTRTTGTWSAHHQAWHPPPDPA